MKFIKLHFAIMVTLLIIGVISVKLNNQSKLHLTHADTVHKDPLILGTNSISGMIVSSGHWVNFRYMSESYRTAEIPKTRTIKKGFYTHIQDTSSGTITNLSSFEMTNSKTWTMDTSSHYSGSLLTKPIVGVLNNFVFQHNRFLMNVMYMGMKDTIKIQINRDSINSAVTWINDSTFILLRKRP